MLQPHVVVVFGCRRRYGLLVARVITCSVAATTRVMPRVRIYLPHTCLVVTTELPNSFLTLVYVASPRHNCQLLAVAFVTTGGYLRVVLFRAHRCCELRAEGRAYLVQKARRHVPAYRS